MNTDMTVYKKLDKRAIAGWRISNAIAFLILMIVVAAAVVFVTMMVPIPWIRTVCYIAAAVIFVYMLLVVFLFPIIEYKQWRYSITEDKVEIRHGIFWVKTTIVPIIRIQHITMAQGPIYKFLGLHKVKISLASGEFEIEGLRKEDATEISEYLKAGIYRRLETSEVNI